MHVSYQTSLLVEPEDALCRRCHDASVSEAARSSYHAGIAGQECTSCHDPHFGASQRLLKATVRGAQR